MPSATAATRPIPKAETAEPCPTADRRSLFCQRRGRRYVYRGCVRFLKLNKKQAIKTLFFLADGEPVMALVRGDHELNETSSAGS